MYLYPGRTKASTLTLVFKYALLLAFVWGNMFFALLPFLILFHTGRIWRDSCQGEEAEVRSVRIHGDLLAFLCALQRRFLAL